MNTKYRVGQEVWRHDVNEDRRGGPERVTITKVGRTLVTIERYRRPETFRIESGRSNDQYGHGWLCTDEEHAEHLARSEVSARLSALHLRFDAGGYERAYSVTTLAAVAELLEATHARPNAAPGTEHDAGESGGV